MTSLLRNTRKSPRADVAQLRRALVASSDSRVQMARFGEALLSGARARQHALGNPRGALLTFALDILLPMRVANVGRHLDRVRVDGEALTRFLDFARESAREQIGDARSADELADAVISALDALHGYVLAHDLVHGGYLEAETALADVIANRDPGEPEPDADPAAGIGAADNNLALAA